MNFQFRHLGLLFTGSLLLASAPALAQGALPGSLGVRVTFPQAALHISGDAGGPADLIIEHLAISGFRHVVVPHRFGKSREVG